VEWEDGDEIEEHLKNKQEAEQAINKEFLFDLYEKSIDQEQGRWQNKINEEDILVSLNHNGTQFSNSHAVILAEFFFPQGTLIKDIMIAIHNHEHRKQWDQGVQEAEILSVKQDSKVLLFHSKVKSSIKQVAERELIEKKIIFKTGDKVVIHFSAVPDEIKE
jgi:hypothetical protein